MTDLHFMEGCPLFYYAWDESWGQWNEECCGEGCGDHVRSSHYEAVNNSPGMRQES